MHAYACLGLLHVTSFCIDANHVHVLHACVIVNVPYILVIKAMHYIYIDSLYIFLAIYVVHDHREIVHALLLPNID